MALGVIRRNDEDLAFALEEEAGDAAIDRLGEGQGAVVEGDVNVFTIDRGVTDGEDSGGIEGKIAELAVQVGSSAGGRPGGGLGLRLRLREGERAEAQGNRHALYPKSP